MATVIYTAQRSLITTSPIHAAGTDYLINLGPITPRPIRTVMRKGARHVSLGGNAQSVHHNRQIFYDITTIPLNQTQFNEMIEFLDSISEGETFQYDATQTAVSPIVTESAQLSGDYSYTEIDPKPLYQISFKVAIL